MSPLDTQQYMQKQTLVLALSTLAFLGTAQAGLINVTDPNLKGTGLGAVLTIVTAQQNGGGGDGVESGCVSWNGSADVIGGCTSGFEGPGGDEKTGASQTLTRELSEVTDLDTIADIGLVFNINETGRDLSILLNDIYFTIFDQSGSEIFSAFLNADSETLTSGTGTGIGQAGFLFTLDDPQRQLAITAETTAGGFNGGWRIGGGFLADEFNAGPETMFVFRAPGGDIPPDEPLPDVPEPTTFLLFGGGLMAAAYLGRRKRT